VGTLIDFIGSYGSQHGSVIDSSNTELETVAIRKLNEKVRQDKRVFISMVPIGDGVTFAMKL
jgi:predicted O-methyltransferase YrrM